MSVAVNGVEAPPSQLVEHLVTSGAAGTGTQVAVHAAAHGERVRGWLVVEERANASDQRCAVIGENGEVHPVGPISSVWVYVREHEMAIPIWARGVAAAAWERQRTQVAFERAQASLNAERELWEQRIETAHQWAIDRRHCSEYDELMDLLGLPGRER